MNELSLSQQDDMIIDFNYSVGVVETNIPDKVGTTEIESLAEIPAGFDDDFIKAEYDGIDKADKLDYGASVACGVLTGSLSLLWSKKFDLAEAYNWGSKKADEVVRAFARKLGYKGTDLSGCIRFLEERFPMAGDLLTNEFGGGKQHHLRDFAHHPTIVGLLCSIIMQFTGVGFGTDTQGNLIHVKITKDGLIGNSFPEKILCGTVNWIGHLISDMAGSSGSVFEGTGRGTGIPGPLLSMIKELSSLKVFSDTDIKNSNNVKTLSLYISKLFNGTLIKDENGNPIKFDLRTEMGIGHYIKNQAKPVIINEVIVRTFYMIRRFINEVKMKDVNSLGDLTKLDVSAFLPFNSRPLTRMITISSGVFVAINTSGTAIKALKKSKGSKAAFAAEFFLSINYVGIGRFVFACSSDAEYIKEDVKEIYDRYIKEKKQLEENAFKLGYHFMSLNEGQLRVLYSLKALAVEYDIVNTKDAKHQLIKKDWLKRWKDATLKSFNIPLDEDYYYSEKDVFSHIYGIDAEAPSKGWFYLVALELALFQAYYPLGNDEELVKGLRYSDKYFSKVFTKEQKLLDKADLTDIEKTYRSYVSKLKESGKRAAIGVVATVATTALTGGVALAFAPEIAVVLAGEAFAGLYGAALTNASLAAIGGGALAAGGFGMVGGTAVLTGGGALLGLAGAGSTSVFTVLSQVTEDYTLNECSKLLTFCKLVVVDKYKKYDLLNLLISGIEKCISQTEIELANLDEKTKQGKKTEKRIRTCLKYLNNTVKEMDILLEGRKKTGVLEQRSTIGEGVRVLIE